MLSSLLINGPAFAAPGADDATLFRVFLKDGGSLVSYGEVARVGDRVVFSMPTGAGSPPPLHLTSLAADRIDWPRTDRYAMSARSGRYIETQAENDYAELSNEVAQTLNEVGQTNDPARRLELVERARRTLVAWPPDHFNYREPDVRQLVTMLDAAIADLRIQGSRGSQGSQGSGQFAFNLIAFTSPPPPIEPLMPAPTLRESIEQVLLAARMSESSTDRVQLYKSALGELDRSRSDSSIPTEWVTTTGAGITQAIATEVRIDKSYQTLTQRMLRLADLRARAGDVRSLERLVTRVHANDTLLGNARPDLVYSLLASIEDKLDAARRLQLARDRFALRAPVLAQYRLAMSGPLEQFAALKSALEDIKSLAGTPPGTLRFIERSIARLVKAANAIQPPAELIEAHALFVSAVSLAQNAASIRREATLASDIARAWDASSAAAGALMLGTKARTDIQTLLRRPQLK
jgi:hypothetical protein